MINIPLRLQQKGINFVLVEKRGKKPFQKEWQKKKINYNDKELLDHIADDGNYGIIGGGEKNLILVDFDNVEVQEKALPLLPETFTVKTGSGMLHLYYFTNGDGSFKGFDEELNTLFDCQSSGKQVIGPGSIHPNGNHYTVVKDVPISFIDYAELKTKLMQFDKKPKKEMKKVNCNDNFESDEFLDELQDNLPMSEVLDHLHVNTDINPTTCPFHDSKGGHCLGFNNETAHCFHCEGSWNIFSMIREYKKCDFKDALDILANMAGMKDQLIENKINYIKRMDQLETETAQRRSAGEKARLAKKYPNRISIPGDTGIIKTIEGKDLDPILEDLKNRARRTKTTRGTSTKDDEIIKIHAPEEKKYGITKD